MDWKPGISHSQVPIQLLYQIQTQIQANLPAERWKDGLAGWHITHTITLSVAILDTNTNRSKKYSRQMEVWNGRLAYHTHSYMQLKYKSLKKISSNLVKDRWIGSLAYHTHRFPLSLSAGAS